ncbi:MAG: hypothetical protein ACR2RD_00615 [Woeseiaceae bacterium]
MTGQSIDWKRHADAVFAPLRSIDRSWLPASLQRHTRLLDTAMRSPTTRRFLYRYLPAADALAVNDIAEPGWAMGGYKHRQQLVIRLGAFACAIPLRHTIDLSERAQLRHVLDDEIYQQVVKQGGTLVRSDISEAYRQAMASGDIAFLIAAMGISVLEHVAPQDRLFIQHHIRSQFARKVWAMRRKDLECDGDRAVEIINQSGHV